jgi:hypothetical protein
VGEPGEPSERHNRAGCLADHLAYHIVGQWWELDAFGQTQALAFQDEVVDRDWRSAIYGADRGDEQRTCLVELSKQRGCAGKVFAVPAIEVVHDDEAGFARLVLEQHVHGGQGGLVGGGRSHAAQFARIDVSSSHRYRRPDDGLSDLADDGDGLEPIDGNQLLRALQAVLAGEDLRKLGPRFRSRMRAVDVLGFETPMTPVRLLLEHTETSGSS